MALRDPLTDPETDPRDDELVALFNVEYEPMVRLAYTILVNQNEAEEVVQDAFADLYRRWREVLDPGAYLRTSVVNGARRALRRRIQRSEVERSNPPRGSADDEYLQDVVDRLPERQRLAVILAYYHGCTSREIGEALGCGRNTAKSLVHRGLKSIRKELRRE